MYLIKKTIKTVDFGLASLRLEDNLLRTGHKLLTEIQPRAEKYNLQKSPLEKMPHNLMESGSRSHVM